MNDRTLRLAIFTALTRQESLLSRHTLRAQYSAQRFKRFHKESPRLSSLLSLFFAS